MPAKAGVQGGLRWTDDKEKMGIICSARTTKRQRERDAQIAEAALLAGREAEIGALIRAQARPGRVYAAPVATATEPAKEPKADQSAGEQRQRRRLGNRARDQ
jgi:hypothetical protein